MLSAPQPILFFLALWTLLTALPLTWALRADSALRRDERVFRLTFVAAPLLLGLVWLHGAWLAAPSAMRLPELLAIAAPGVLFACLLAYAGVRSIDRAWNRRTAAISYGLQICAWLLLHRLPAALVEVAQTFDWRAHTRDALGQAAPLALAALAPLPVIAVAFLFARQAVERRASA